MGQAVFVRPGSGVGMPVNREGRLGCVECVEDEGGAAQVIGGADYFGRGPVVLMHELGRVIDVLDGVEGLGFFEDIGGRDPLSGGELSHGMGFDEVVVGGAAGHDEVASDAGFVLADAFEDALALFGGGGAVGIGGCAEDDDGVEVGLGGVVGWEGDEVACNDEREGKCQDGEVEEGSGEELHEG